MNEKKYDLVLTDDSAEKTFILGFPITNFGISVSIDGDDLQSALDNLADYLVENEEYQTLYGDYQDILDNADGEDIDEYIQNNNLICVGNSCVYMQCPVLLEEIKK